VNEEQLKRIQELLERIKQQAKELGETSPFSQDPRFSSEESIRNIQDTSKAFEDLENQFQSYSNILDAINNDLGGIEAALAATVAEFSKSNEPINKVRNAYRDIGRVATDLKLDQRDVINLSDKQLETLDKRLQRNFSILESNKDLISTSKENLEQEVAALINKRDLRLASKEELRELERKTVRLKEVSSIEKIINDEIQARQDRLDGVIERETTIGEILEARIKQRKEEERQVKKATEDAKSVADVLGKVPLIGPSIKEAFGEVQQEVRDIIKEQGELPEGFNATGLLISKLGPKIKKNLTNPILLASAALKQLYSALKQVDTQAGDLAKQFNLTYFEAQRIRQEFVGIAGSTNEIFVTSKGLLETLSAINQSLGTRQFTGLSDGFEESLVFLTKLREQAGLTNEELVGVSQLVLATGDSAEAITAEFLAQAQISSARQGVLVNEKELFREIKNISAATLLSLQRSPAAIADAAATAKALGLQLSQVEKIADGLLQFESSITSELEAELLLGRNLNLERARFAALNNDIATVAKEIAQQAGSAAEFAKLNRIQQQALADAVMMSREELGAQLLIQEQLGTLTGEAADRRRAVIDNLIAERGLQGAINVLGQESIETLEKQASVAEEFNAIILQLKEAFVGIATALAPIGKVLGYVGVVIKGLLNPVKTLVSFFDGLGESVEKVAATVDRLLTGAGIGALTGAAIGMIGGPIGAGAGALIGAGIASVGEIVTSFADDIVYPNKSEYGDTVIKGPEGTFKLNDKDKAVIAGTDGSFRELGSTAVSKAMTDGSFRELGSTAVSKAMTDGSFRELGSTAVSKAMIDGSFRDLGFMRPSERQPSYRGFESIKPMRSSMTGQTYTIANESMFNPVSNINTSQVSTINNNTQNLDLKELLSMNKKLIEVTENQTRVLAKESEMTRRSKQKLQVGVQDFGTDVSMFSSRVEFG
jgi:hypothetical protein